MSPLSTSGSSFSIACTADWMEALSQLSFFSGKKICLSFISKGLFCWIQCPWLIFAVFCSGNKLWCFSLLAREISPEGCGYVNLAAQMLFLFCWNIETFLFIFHPWLNWIKSDCWSWPPSPDICNLLCVLLSLLGKCFLVLGTLKSILNPGILSICFSDNTPAFPQLPSLPSVLPLHVCSFTVCTPSLWRLISISLASRAGKALLNSLRALFSSRISVALFHCFRFSATVTKCFYFLQANWVPLKQLFHTLNVPPVRLADTQSLGPLYQP